ncbi:MAG: DUF2341 domain-containing protein [Proteobacteria bacterium]|nr:DUF2341 domain-containing protein [Burkholderiales bacterium]
MNRLLSALLCMLIGLALPLPAAAWWNDEWTGRKKITLNTGDSGAVTKESVTQAVVAVRLHTGNFSFLDAKEDASDIRFIGADDKTPLKFHVERFDATNELAVIWVQVPEIAAGRTSEIWMYYGNQKATSASDPKGTYDPAQLLVFHFAESSGNPMDSTSFGHNAAQSTAKIGTVGVLGSAASFDGTGRIGVGAVPSLRVPATGGLTVMAWVKLAADAPGGQLVQFGEAGRGLTLAIEKGRAVARFITAASRGEASATNPLKPDAWHHLAVTVGAGRLTLFVDGEAAGTANVQMAETGGDVLIGTGLRGELDEVSVASAARSADWVRVAYATQGGDGRLLAVTDGGAAASGGGDHAYLGVLVDSLTIDAWVVIAICGVMLVISIFVMIAKAIYVSRLDAANQRFLKDFARIGADLTRLKEASARLGGSSLFRLYRIGIEELEKRLNRDDGPAAPPALRSVGAAAVMPPPIDEVNLSVQTLGAIQSSMNGGLVRENHLLNRQMVLLTIAISGGPFLGLLGTVVGVMITFAAIAAAGDVNVNAIAPGIAAALLATVAGLGVAIPALFGYNYLATRIKTVNTDMQVFVEEFMARMAERYSR